MKKLFTLMFIAACLAACSQQEANVVLDPRQESPEACYDAFRQSWNNGDIETAFELLTPRAQQQHVGLQVTLIGLHLGMGGDHDAPLGKALLALLEQRGFDSYRAFGKRYKEILGPDENDLEGEADDLRNREALYAMAQEMGHAATFMTEMSRIDREVNPNTNFLPKYRSITEVTIDGNSAQGWHLIGRGKAGYSIDFVREDDGWIIDQLLMMPVRWPGDQQYRDEAGVIQSYSAD